MPTIWERTDAFAKGTPAYGAAVLQYINCKIGAAYTQGQLGVPTGLVPPFQAYAHGTDGGAPTLPTAFLKRVQDGADVEVGARSFLSASILIPYYSGLLREFGVVARASGGTIAGDGTTDVRFEDVNCYAFHVTSDVSTYPADVTVTFAVVRYDAGVPTTFGTPLTFAISDGSGNPGAFNGINFASPIGLKLQVFTNGSGNPVLNPIISYIDASLGVPFTDIPLSLLGYGPFADSSGSKITAAGRSGFIVSQDENLSGILIKNPVHEFQVRDFTSAVLGDVYHRDEWHRALSTGALAITDDFGTSMRSSQSAFIGDQHTTGGTERLSYGATFPEISGTSTVGTTAYVLMSQRVPDDSRSQAPEVHFELTYGGSSGASPKVGGGVVAHGVTFSESPAALTQGYVAWAYYVPGDGWYIELRRYNGGVSTLLASGSGSIYSIGSTTRIRLVLEATPLPGAPTLDGPVQLRVLANTTGLAPTAQTLTLQTVTGVAASGAYVIDSSASRATSGMEGLFFEHQHSTHTTRYALWDQQPLVAPPTAINDMPSIAFTGEAAASNSINTVADFVASYSAPAEHPLLETRFESGHASTRVLERTARRVWPAVRTAPMDETARDAFLAFWRANCTPGRAFFYTDPMLNATYPVRAIDGTLEEDRLFHDVFVFTFGMQELRA